MFMPTLAHPGSPLLHPDPGVAGFIEVLGGEFGVVPTISAIEGVHDKRATTTTRLAIRRLEWLRLSFNKRAQNDLMSIGIANGEKPVPGSGCEHAGRAPATQPQWHFNQ
jgi:hypothetical protein